MFTEKSLGSKDNALNWAHFQNLKIRIDNYYVWLGVNSNASALYFFTIAKIHAFYSKQSPCSAWTFSHS